MSQDTFPNASTPGSTTLERGLEALRTGSEFHGLDELPDGHDCTGHFAQIYETDAERFAAAVTFVRDGLARDEHVIYVVDEHSQAEVRAALCDSGLDVDAALEEGALSFHTVRDTYLRNGSFEPDEMIEFYADAVAAATREREGIRIVAETTWLQGETVPVERFMEYESKVNDFFADEDCLTLCQYDRDGFPPEIVESVVQTHPHLVYDDAVCHNVYYTPPAEFLSDEGAARKVDRMLGTLRERTEAKTDLARHERFLHDLYEITATRDRSFEEKLQALFELGCERFGLEFGFLNRIDSDADRLVVEYASGDHEHYEPGAEFSLSETYCQAAVDIKEAASIANPAEEGFDDRRVYADFGVDGYLGTYIPVDGGADRTLAFVPDGSYEGSFSERDRASLELMGQWLGYELDRRQREQFLRECYEITSDPALDFERKLHRLLDLARERMGLDVAGLTHLPEWDGQFLIEYALGYGGDGRVNASDDVWTDPGEGCYCRQAIVKDRPVGMADVRGTEWEDDDIHREHGLTCYLGTKVTSGSTPYGTLWVGDTEPRDREFSETERAFLELMGQWISYELDRRERERELRERTEHLSALVENFPNGSVGLYDEDYTYTVVGGELLDDLGLSPDDVVGTTIHDHYPDALTDRIESNFRAVFDGESNTFEVDLEDRNLLAHTLPVRNAAGEIHAGMVMVQDITERTERERELERALDLLDKTERIADVGGWEIDPETKDVFWTDHIFELLEVPADEEPDLDEALDMYHQEDQSIVEDAVEDALDTGDPFDVEVRVRTASDEVRWLRLQGVPETVDGEVVSFRGTVQDITERKEREHELRRTERRFEAIFEDPNILVGLLEPDGTVLDINQTAMEYIDADLQEVIDKPFWETPWWGGGDEVQNDVREWVDRAAAGEYVNFEADLTRPDGQRYTLNGVFRPVTNDEGDVVSVIVSDRDITERKERERALKQSEQRYRTLAEAFPNGIVTLFDENLRYTLAAGQAFDVLPVSRDDLEGRTPREVWNDDVADELEPLCRAVFDGEKNSVEVSYEGREWVIYAVPITDEKGDVFAGMTMAQDITDRKENRRKLEESNERLESFASMLAHELRNPVNIGQIYSRRLPAETESKAVRYVTEAFDRIEDMIDVMLVLTRGRKAIGEPSPIELADATREAWDDIDTPDAALDVELDQTIQAEETYVRHMVRNLLENAVEHGGSDVTVTVGELPDGFYVADDGSGIPEEDREAVFDQGYTTAGDRGGTGLGLAFVQKLAEVYGWEYAVTESEAGGARFEFRNVT